MNLFFLESLVLMIVMTDDDGDDGDDDDVVAGKPGGVAETPETGGVRALSGVPGLQHSPGGRHHQYRGPGGQ